MKIKVNKYIPFEGFLSINLYGTLFVREEYAYKLDDKDFKLETINHESIHTEQMKDFCRWLPVGGTIYYLIYLLEWLFRVLFVHPFSHKAYRSISFEQEAYAHERDENYLSDRKHFAQWRKKSQS